MPDFMIKREESENDHAHQPSWALVPSPGYVQTEDGRALVPASESWASKRYSNPNSPLAEDVPRAERASPYNPIPDPFEFPQNSTGLTFYFSAHTINFGGPAQFHEDGDRQPSPVEKHSESESDISVCPRTRPPRQALADEMDIPVSPRIRSSRQTWTEEAAFFNWAEFCEDVIPKKKTPMKTSHEDVIDAFSGVEVSGPVKGLGRLAKPLINKYHSSSYVSEFQASGERVLLRPRPSEDEQPTTPTTTRRELERLECELFDMSKYLGNTNYLTVLTWASDSHWGTITLFEVDVAETNGAADRTRSRKRHRKGPLQEGVKIRPVAAMEDVPKGILVNMRVDQDIRKTVLEHSDGRFRWRAQVRPGPSYARVARSASLSPRYYTREKRAPRSMRAPSSRAVLSDSEDEDMDEEPDRTYAMRGRQRNRRDADGEHERDGDSRIRSTSLATRRRRPRPRSLLRVEDALSTRNRHRTRGATSRGRSAAGKAETKPDTGIVATIPQFMALLHANRSILEVVSSLEGDDMVEISDDDWDGRRRDTTLRSVTMAEKPIGRHHAARDVHVVVLMPNSAYWAEERIFWTDERGELANLRQKVFWDVIERGRSCSSRSSRSRSVKKRVSRSIDGGGRTRRTGGRRHRDPDERSRSPPRSARW